MADPVSWFMIEPGWRVDAADGTEVGRVEEVTGDSNADIFDGLAVAFSMTGTQHYVPAEQVGTIVDGTVTLNLDADAIHKLGEFEEPAEEVEIEPDKASRHERLETKLLHPAEHEHPTGLWRRIAEWFGKTGR